MSNASISDPARYKYCQHTSPPSFKRVDRADDSELSHQEWLLWKATQQDCSLSRGDAPKSHSLEQEGTQYQGHCGLSDRRSGRGLEKFTYPASQYSRPLPNSCEIPTPPTRPLRNQNTCEVSTHYDAVANYYRDSRIKGPSGVTSAHDSRSSLKPVISHIVADEYKSPDAQPDAINSGTKLTLPLRSRQVKPDSYLIQQKMSQHELSQHYFNSAPPDNHFESNPAKSSLDQAASEKDKYMNSLFRSDSKYNLTKSHSTTMKEKSGNDAHVLSPVISSKGNSNLPPFEPRKDQNRAADLFNDTVECHMDRVKSSTLSHAPSSNALGSINQSQLSHHVSHVSNYTDHMAPHPLSSSIAKSISREHTKTAADSPVSRQPSLANGQLDPGKRSYITSPDKDSQAHSGAPASQPVISRVDTEGATKPLDTEYCRALQEPLPSSTSRTPWFAGQRSAAGAQYDQSSSSQEGCGCGLTHSRPTSYFQASSSTIALGRWKDDGSVDAPPPPVGIRGRHEPYGPPSGNLGSASSLEASSDDYRSCCPQSPNPNVMRRGNPCGTTWQVLELRKKKMDSRQTGVLRGEKVSIARAREQIIQENDAFIFDMDGVLWKGSQTIPGAPEAIEDLTNRGKKVFFCTNNSTLSRGQFKDKLGAMGYPQDKFDVDQILCTSLAAAELLRKKGIRGKILVYGSEALCRSINEVEGCTAFTIANKLCDQTDFNNVKIDPGIKAVVLGFDPLASYYRIAYATCILREVPESVLIITNEDKNILCPTHILPGAGSLAQSLISSVDKEPLWCGKPQSLMADVLLQKHQLTPSRVCMVGDNLATDITFGNKANLNTLLVESGMHNRTNCPAPPTSTCKIPEQTCNRGLTASTERLEQIKERRRREKEALRERRRIEREQEYERTIRLKEEDDERRRQFRAEIAQRILQLKNEEEAIREKLRTEKADLRDRQRRDRDESQERRCKLENELLQIEERLIQERERQREEDRRERDLLRTIKKQEKHEIKDLERRFREESVARRMRLRREKEELEERLRREKEELQMRFEYLEKKAEERVRQEKNELVAVQRHRRSESQERFCQSKRQVEENIRVLEEQLVEIERRIRTEEESVRERLREEKECLEARIERELAEFQSRTRQEFEELNERRRRVREESQERRRRLREASQERRDRFEMEKCEVREIHEVEKEATAESKRTLQLERLERERLAQKEEELRLKKAEIDATLECIRQQRDHSMDRADKFVQQAEERRRRLLKEGKLLTAEIKAEEILLEDGKVEEAVEALVERELLNEATAPKENRYVVASSTIALLENILDDILEREEIVRELSDQSHHVPVPTYILPSLAEIRNPC